MRQAMGAMIIQKRMGQKRPRPGEGDSRETGTTSSSEAGADGVAGTLILDATCSPVDSRFPQDFSRLNEAREKTDEIIDVLHRQVAAKGERHPRTYREVLHKAYLGMAKAKKRPANKMRALVRKLLLALARNLGFIEALLARGGRLTDRQARMLDAIGELYRQQKMMFDARNHRVGSRKVPESGI